jgi:hypothetical protein
MVEQAEAVRTLPAAGFDIGDIGAQVAAQGQHQGEAVLGHRDARIIADIRDHDAARAAGGQVDVVGAGGGNGHHAQRRQLVEPRRAAAPCW